MELIASFEDWSYWNGIGGDDPSQPFERRVARSFAHIVGAGYSAMFHLRTVEAFCAWSQLHDFVRIAMFFTRPSPQEYHEKAGFYGGIVVSGHDDPEEIERFVAEHGGKNIPFSIYDASQRFIIVPEDGRWLVTGDRDAEVCLFGFITASDCEKFFDCGDGITTFDSLEDTVSYAKSFMDYRLNIAGL